MHSFMHNYASKRARIPARAGADRPQISGGKAGNVAQLARIAATDTVQAGGIICNGCGWPCVVGSSANVSSAAADLSWLKRWRRWLQSSADGVRVGFPCVALVCAAYMAHLTMRAAWACCVCCQCVVLTQSIARRRACMCGVSMLCAVCVAVYMAVHMAHYHCTRSYSANVLAT